MKIDVRFIPSAQDRWNMEVLHFEETGEFPGEFSPLNESQSTHHF
jgi:hypothetical protein